MSPDQQTTDNRVPLDVWLQGLRDTAEQEDKAGRWVQANYMRSAIKEIERLLQEQSAQSTDKPPHPLVVDETTGLCCYVTQDDIRRMEAISSAYRAMVEDARRVVERSDALLGKLSGISQ